MLAVRSPRMHLFCLHLSTAKIVGKGNTVAKLVAAAEKKNFTSHVGIVTGPPDSAYDGQDAKHAWAGWVYVWSNAGPVSLVIYSRPAEGHLRLLHAAAEARQGCVPQASCTSSSSRRSASTTASISLRPRAYTGRTTGLGSQRGRSEWWPRGAAPTNTPTPSRCAALRGCQDSGCGTLRRIICLKVKHVRKVHNNSRELREEIAVLVTQATPARRLTTWSKALEAQIQDTACSSPRECTQGLLGSHFSSTLSHISH